MNMNDPSLYSVTPREMTAYPFAWQNIPRFVPPFQTYGVQPFQSYGMQPFYPYGMQPFYPYGMQPYYPVGLNAPYQAPTLPTHGAQPFVPPTFAYGYNTPLPTPWLNPQLGLPFCGGIQGWQKPNWY